MGKAAVPRLVLLNETPDGGERNWAGGSLGSATILGAPPIQRPCTNPTSRPDCYTGTTTLSPTTRVLIVDRWRESRNLLRSVLSRSGAEVLEARGPDDALQLAVDSQPDVIIVDSDGEHGLADSAAAAQLADAAARKAVPIVVLGAFRRRASPLPTEEFVAKPYHYGALVRRIEELLGNRP